MTKILVASELRPGHLITYEDGIYEVEKYDFVTQGRGGSTVDLILENIKNGTRKNISITAHVKFSTVDSTENEYEYMYDDGDSIYCADGSEFPVNKVQKDVLELIPQAGVIRVITLNDEIYKIVLPKKAKVKIMETEPYLKGQTAGSSFKPAKLSNGWIIQVPIFLEDEDVIILNTSDLTYDSKA